MQRVRPRTMHARELPLIATALATLRPSVSPKIVTFAALACFVLVPIIGLLVLSVFRPELFDDDALGWASPFPSEMRRSGYGCDISPNAE